MTARCQVANMSHETSSTAALWALNIGPSSPPGGTLNSLTVTSPPGGTLVTWGLPDVEKIMKNWAASGRSGVRDPIDVSTAGNSIYPPTDAVGVVDSSFGPWQSDAVARWRAANCAVAASSSFCWNYFRQVPPGGLAVLKLLLRSSFCQKATG